MPHRPPSFPVSLRPNPLGLSFAKIERVAGRRLFVSGVDIVDGTPGSVGGGGGGEFVMFLSVSQKEVLKESDEMVKWLKCSFGYKALPSS
jgi:hypothetical protein